MQPQPAASVAKSINIYTVYGFVLFTEQNVQRNLIFVSNTVKARQSHNNTLVQNCVISDHLKDPLL